MSKRHEDIVLAAGRFSSFVAECGDNFTVFPFPINTGEKQQSRIAH